MDATDSAATSAVTPRSETPAKRGRGRPPTRHTPRKLDLGEPHEVTDLTGDDTSTAEAESTASTGTPEAESTKRPAIQKDNISTTSTLSAKMRAKMAAKRPATRKENDGKRPATRTKDDGLKTSAAKQQPQQSYKGMMIRKDFDGMMYTGSVVSGPYTVEDRDEPVWKVIYEDDDEEEFTADELMEVACPEPYIGMTISKLFDDGQYYTGRVISGPVTDLEEALGVPHWLVKYVEDSDEEHFTKEELQRLTLDKNAKQKQKKPKKAKYARAHQRMDYQAIKKDLMYLVGVNEGEIVAALDQMEPPYGMNRAMQLIHEAKQDAGATGTVDEERFVIQKGLKIRKNEMGSAYHGEVTSDKFKKIHPITGEEVFMWTVTYIVDDDELYEDMDWLDLLMWRASRPLCPNPVRGRQLCSLELFSGCGMVTQEFANRNWRVKSIDNSLASYATNVVDIMQLKFDEHVGMIPDFIWASPPCFTYSNMAGGLHRNPKNEEWDLTEEARLNDRFLVRLLYILRWAKSKNPHLIVVIENPRASLSKMPLMRELEESMELSSVVVDYCAFGRDDKKPTHLWTNDFNLRANLGRFTCQNMCKKKRHAIGVRSNGHNFNSAAIPQPLAAEVAECVGATFYMQQVRYKKQATMTEAEKLEFNKAMAATAEEAALEDARYEATMATEDQSLANSDSLESDNTAEARVVSEDSTAATGADPQVASGEDIPQIAVGEDEVMVPSESVPGMAAETAEDLTTVGEEIGEDTQIEFFATQE